MATKKGVGKRHGKIAIAGLSGAALVACQAIAAFAAGTPAAIKSISVDSNQQLVIQFASNGSFPAVPHLLDVPGPSHRVVFDFVNAKLDRGTLPSSEIFSSRISKALPVIKGFRYLDLTSTPKPTARIVIDLPEKLEVKPKVVKLEEGLVVLSLGDGVDLTVKDKEEGGPRSQRQQALLEPVAEATDSATGAETQVSTAQEKTAPTPGGANAAMEAAESAAASAPSASSAPVTESAEAPVSTTTEIIAADANSASEKTPVQAIAAQEKPSAGESENVGSWDWTAGQPAQAAAPTVKTAQADESDVTTPTIPVVATNVRSAPVPVVAQSQAAADDGVQSELQKEAGAVPAAPVELKPAMPESETPAAPQSAASQSAAPAAEQEAPQAVAPQAPAETAADAAPEAAPAESAPVPVQKRTAAPVQKRVGAPVPKDDPIEREVRTETPDQAPEQEIDGPTSKLSLPQDPESAKTAAESKAEAKVSYNKAVQAHLAGKLPEAISQYQNALTLNPEFSQAHCNLGLIFNQQHNYAKALSEFRKALAINPKDAITYNGIGAALRAEKDMVGAIKNWQTAVSLDPKLATAHYNLGTAYEIQKDTDRALESYKQAVKNDYRLGEAYYRMGLIMEKRKLNDEATEQYSRALKVANDAEFSEDARQRLASLSNKKR